jgi:hypothetical protein
MRGGGADFGAIGSASGGAIFFELLNRSVRLR